MSLFSKWCACHFFEINESLARRRVGDFVHHLYFQGHDVKGTDHFHLYQRTSVYHRIYRRTRSSTLFLVVFILLYSVNILTVGLSPKYSDSVGVDSVGPRRRPLGHRRTALEHVHIRRLAGCLVNFNIHHLISSLHFPRIRHGRKRGKVE